MDLLCTNCDVIQPSDNFPDAKTRGKIYINGPRGGKSSHCKSCNNLRAKKWATNNKTRVNTTARNGHLNRKFGLTIQTFTEMLEKQNNVCDLCHCTVDSPRVKQKNFCVDHDHITGKVRAILCDSCNLILGNADDNIVLLQKCIKYLEKHSGALQ